MTESHTTVGVTGVVRTTLVAIGGGAQLFPGKGGPYNKSRCSRTGRQGRGEAVVGVVGRVRGAVGKVADGAVTANLQGVQVRARVRGEVRGTLMI